MWFTENPWPPIVICGGMAVIFFFMWNANRRGLHLLLCLGCLALCGLWYVVERAIVTDGERLQAKVIQLCEDFRDKKPGVTDYVSDAHPDIKILFASASALVTVGNDLRMSDFQSTISNDGQQGTVHFRANATITIMGHGNVGYQPARLILTFQREKEDWKIIKVQRLNPINGNEMPALEQSAG